MTPKTILQHLNRLPECVRLDVKLEFVRQGVNLDRKVHPSRTLSDVIIFYINWGSSEIGYEYYCKLYEDILYHEQHNLKLPK